MLRYNIKYAFAVFEMVNFSFTNKPIVHQRTTRMKSWSPYILLYILANNVQSVSAQSGCPAGSFVDGNAICQSCLLGKYTTSTNTLTACTDCVPGKYSNSIGAFIEKPLFQTRTFKELANLDILGFASMPGTDNVFFCAKSSPTTLVIYKTDMKTFATTLIYSTTLSYSMTQTELPFNPIFRH